MILKNSLNFPNLLLLLGITGLIASACADKEITYCHHWTPAEKAELYKADTKFVKSDPNNPLHGIIKDYERVCADIK